MDSPNFYYQDEGYFFKIWFFLISIMVSTSRNKSCKILSCLAEIVFWVFASGNHYRNMEDNFKRKTSLDLAETVFLASDIQFFPFVRYSWLWKQFFRQVETFFYEFVNPAGEKGKSIFLFRALWSFWNSGVAIPACGNWFSG